MLKFTLVLTFLLALAYTSQAKISSRSLQNFHCNDLVNEQIRQEMEASQVYLSLYKHFAHDLVALKGFAQMMKESWKEELEHAEKLIDYLVLRGGNVTIPMINKPVNDTMWCSMDVCEILKSVLGLEMSVHESLLNVHKCAVDGPISEDPHLQGFLESEFLDEQIETNRELAELLTKIERATLTKNADGSKVALCDGLGLELVDKELIVKYEKKD